MKDGFIKTAAVTPELRVADCAFNADRIIEQVKDCADSGVKLAVFPELSITGYSCGDLFFTDSLLELALENLVRTANATAQTDVLFFVGAPVRSQGRLYNAAFAVCAGEILGAVPKSFIPNYNEFYEKRYFCSGEDVCATLKINGKALPLSRRLLFCHDKIKEFTVSDDYKVVMKWINIIDELLNQNFSINFGNRMLNQILKYVPLYVECGGSKEEAFDDFVSKKILRKLESKDFLRLGPAINKFLNELDEYYGKDSMPLSREYLKKFVQF